MDERYYIGVDNGVTGSIGIIDGSLFGVDFFKIPVKKEQNYTKKKGFITRVDVPNLIESLRPFSHCPSHVIIERPYVNPQGFKATVSAIRCLEAVLISVEMLGMSFEYVDSRSWQREALPAGCSGSELKLASLSMGIRLFPQFESGIRKHGDADSLLMAVYRSKGFK